MDELIAEFRLVFTEFKDETVFPNSVVWWWIELAQVLVSEERFGDLYKKALFLLTAHKLSLWHETQKAAASGNYGKTAAGQVQSKSVGGASVTYAVQNSTGSNFSEGDFLLTSYGRAYLSLCAMLCQGCVQL